MMMYSRELTVNWGESDPFGLVYFPLMLAWFNDTEHELLRAIGYSTDKLIRDSRTAFVTEIRCAREMICNAVQAEREGYDAFIVGHFQDAGLYELRKVVDIPVIGLGEATMQWC